MKNNKNFYILYGIFFCINFLIIWINYLYKSNISCIFYCKIFVWNDKIDNGLLWIFVGYILKEKLFDRIKIFFLVKSNSLLV